ncbi:4'-phosphopantetheinyl transferase family protein [Marinicella sp. W31]|uniref:4'-phosphopantetheinyl transferase family protein n=1 Tax=Marinicella sp. W31 TaxID=3023713 RepID=UPI003756E69E
MSDVLKIWVHYNPTECRDQSAQVLQKLLMHYTNSHQPLKIMRTEKGKPFVHEAIEFSYSHSRGVYVYCFSDSSSVGVDIEKIDTQRPCLKLARRYFHKQELMQLEKLPAQARTQLFFRLWTAKEALCKYEGGVLWSYLGVNLLSQVNDMPSALHQQFAGIRFYPVLRFNGFSFTVAIKRDVKNCVINRLG